MFKSSELLTSAFLASETTAAESGLYRARDPARTYAKKRENSQVGNSYAEI